MTPNESDLRGSRAAGERRGENLPRGAGLKADPPPAKRDRFIGRAKGPELLLLTALWIVALTPPSLALDHRSATATEQPVERAGMTQIWMRNLILFPYGDVPTSVSALDGAVRPTKQGRAIVLDDVTSYAISVERASVALTAADVTALMNRHILPIGNSPIKQVNVTFDDGAISMSGTMVKLGIPMPSTANAVLAPTRDGDLRVHMTAMRAGDVVPKSVMDALGLQLSNIAQPENPRAFRMEGDDMVVPLISMFPPPLMLGKLTAVRVTRAGLFATIGQGEVTSPPGIQASSYLHMRGGTVVFAKKLTMANADMTMVPLDASRNLGFSPSDYYEQMVGGYTISMPDYSLVAHVKDFRDLRNRR